MLGVTEKRGFSRGIGSCGVDRLPVDQFDNHLTPHQQDNAP